jgi:nicotinamidase/pyrazinamidase
VRFDKDQNSAFDDTGLAVELRQRGVHRIWVGGLAPVPRTPLRRRGARAGGAGRPHTVG